MKIFQKRLKHLQMKKNKKNKQTHDAKNSYLRELKNEINKWRANN